MLLLIQKLEDSSHNAPPTRLLVQPIAWSYTGNSACLATGQSSPHYYNYSVLKQLWNGPLSQLQEEAIRIIIVQKTVHVSCNNTFHFPVSKQLNYETEHMECLLWVMNLAVGCDHFYIPSLHVRGLPRKTRTYHEPCLLD